MESARGNTLRANDDFVLFATSRPSRTNEVVSTEQERASRLKREKVWAEKIGIDAAAIKQIGFQITGSPSGTKHPHEFDDEYDDILP